MQSCRRLEQNLEFSPSPISALFCCFESRVTIFRRPMHRSLPTFHHHPKHAHRMLTSTLRLNSVSKFRERGRNNVRTRRHLIRFFFAFHRYGSFALSIKNYLRYNYSSGTQLTFRTKTSIYTMSTEEELSQKITELGEQIKKAKADGKPKEEWDPLLKEMLLLKVRTERC